MADRHNFTENELKSIATNAMGRSSEAGQEAVMKLGLAVNVNRNGAIQHKPRTDPKANNSGYSAGLFQWDFGARKNGKDFIKDYNNSTYVKEHPEKAITDEDINKYTKLLNQNRDSDGGVQKYDTIRRSQVGKDFNAFLATDDGYKFVMLLQEEQFKRDLESAMKSALNSPAVQNMSKEDAVETLAAIAKVKNQAGSIKPSISTLMNNSDQIATKDQILDKIYTNYPDHVDKGVKATLGGAKLYNELSNDTGKLGEIFKERNKTNPIVVPNFKESPNDQLLDGMFRQPAKAEKLIKAVNNNNDYIVPASNKTKNETYTVGVKDGDIFTVDKNGAGYRFENGEWKGFNNNEDKFLFKDKKGNWSVEEQQLPSLKLGSRGDRVTELQNNLNTLIESESLSGNKIATSGYFGKNTEKAVKTFQGENGLSVNGVAGKDTLGAIQTKLGETQTKNDIETDSKQTASASLQDTVAKELGMSSEAVSNAASANQITPNQQPTAQSTQTTEEGNSHTR
ncbi:MAG: peptidoglycan-binding protein [Endomicrobium sp.]|jgi:murein L,D-transpeptidase YcbB/YkuD|nr:peptidoglycan-binding protein [Endomicrobium sp.]